MSTRPFKVEVQIKERPHACERCQAVGYEQPSCLEHLEGEKWEPYGYMIAPGWSADSGQFLCPACIKGGCGRIKGGCGRYFQDFSNIDQLRRSFEIDEATVQDSEVLFAAYCPGHYSGSAQVIFQRGGQLFEVVGSHCSCRGLEGQWTPAEVTWAALALRPGCAGSDNASEETTNAWRDLVRAHQPSELRGQSA